MNLGSLEFKPHPAQLEIDKAFDNYRFITEVCGRRFGKTIYWVNKLIKCAWEDPGNYAYILPTTTQAKMVAWQMFIEYFPDPFKPDKWKNESELWLSNLKGGKIILGGADNPDRWRGVKLKGAIFDEFADMKPYIIDVIEPALGDYTGFGVFLGTPKGYNHFYEMFIKDVNFNDPTYESYNGNRILSNPLYKSFKFKTSDNPYFPKESLEQAKTNLTDEMFRQEYEASFENFTGLIYREFMDNKEELLLQPIYDENERVIGCKRKSKEFDVEGKAVTIVKDVIFQPYWNYYHGIDTGRYTAWLFVAVDHEDNIYVFDEIFNVDGLVEEISEEIKFKIKGKKIKGEVIDSASQVKIEYRNKGIKFRDSFKDVLGSIEMMRSKMKANKYFVLNNCRMHIKELCSRKWDEKKKISVKGKRKNVPEDGSDHTCNVAEYIFLTFLKYKNNIETPRQKRYKQSMDYLVKQQPVVSWEDRG